MLSTEQLATLRAGLEAEEQRLRSELAEIDHSDNAELSFDANFADSSQVTAERGELDALSQALVDGLEHVTQAIERIDNGTYGHCQECGAEIDFDRLQARPEARRCINCASK